MVFDIDQTDPAQVLASISVLSEGTVTANGPTLSNLSRVGEGGGGNTLNTVLVFDLSTTGFTTSQFQSANFTLEFNTEAISPQTPALVNGFDVDYIGTFADSNFDAVSFSQSQVSVTNIVTADPTDAPNNFSFDATGINNDSFSNDFAFFRSHCGSRTKLSITFNRPSFSRTSNFPF